ncbi:hypothetical protein TNCV_3398491 [Trichonephila clavipes]|nr:hypothetical protein TNCV_3398491 [Trichonephila clavipes]
MRSEVSPHLLLTVVGCGSNLGGATCGPSSAPLSRDGQHPERRSANDNAEELINIPETFSKVAELLLAKFDQWSVYTATSNIIRPASICLPNHIATNIDIPGSFATTLHSSQQPMNVDPLFYTLSENSWGVHSAPKSSLVPSDPKV